MENDALIHALTEQVACYRRLAKLAAIQHEHIQNARTEDLLTVLRSRQEVLDSVAEHEKRIGPAKQRWAHYALTMDTASRTKAEALLSETRGLLEQITTADRRDVLVLQQRKLNIGKRISQTTGARKLNRNYAAAAYGTTRPRMDLQM